MRLTNEGFKLLATCFTLTLAATTVIVYPPLTLSVYAVSVFALTYILLTANRLSRIRSTAFGSSRRLDVKTVRPGERFTVEVTLTNLSETPLLVVLNDNMDKLVLVEGPLSVEEKLQPKQSVTLRYRAYAPARGVYRLGPPVVKVVDECGLVCRVIVLEERANLYVFPTMVEKPRLSEGVKAVQNVYVSGTGLSVKYGVEDVFREVSEYEEGQPLKAVDWRRTARMDGELYVKKFDRVNRLRILFLVEATKGSLVGNPPLLDSVFDAVMAVTKSMVESGDIVTVRLLGPTGGNTVTVYNTAGLEELAYLLITSKPVPAYDLVKETEEIGEFDAAFLIGRLVNVRHEQLSQLSEKLRKKGCVLFTLIPALEAENRIQRSLTTLEDMRVDRFLRIANVAKVSQHSLASYLAHLHRVLRAAA